MYCQEGDSVQDLYASFSGSYDEYVTDVADMQTNNVMVELMFRYWPQSPCGGGAKAATLLDIGCGTGLIGKRFMQEAGVEFFATHAERQKSVLRGIDFSDDMLSKVPQPLYDAMLHNVDEAPWPCE